MSEKTIILDGVSKSFQREEVIRKVSLAFEGGRIYGLVGRNGSGKTVLMKLICGFLWPDEGTVEVMGKRLGKEQDFPESMGALIETPGFLGGVSGFRNLKYLAQIKGKAGDEQIKAAMERMGLDWKDKKRVSRYSLGMKQRLGVAQALMEDPDILLLDEPMNGLDEKSRENLRSLLLSEKEKGKTIVLSSHQKEDIELLCDIVYEFKDGQVRLIPSP